MFYVCLIKEFFHKYNSVCVCECTEMKSPAKEPTIYPPAPLYSDCYYPHSKENKSEFCRMKVCPIDAKKGLYHGPSTAVLEVPGSLCFQSSPNHGRDLNVET